MITTLSVFLGLAVPPVPTDAEIDALAKSLSRRYQALATTPCPPALRAAEGAAKAASGSAALAAWLAEPATQACIAASRDAGGKAPDDPIVQAAGEACAAQPARLRRLADATVGCRLGVGQIERPLSLMHLGQGVVAASRSRPPDAAAWTLLELARVTRLAERDGTLIAAAVSAAIQTLAYDALLERSPEAGLAELRPALQRLRASAHHPSRVATGEGVYMALQAVVSAVMPADWSPPGGWPGGKRPEVGLDASKELGFVGIAGNPRGEAALIWWALEQVSAAQERACPVGSALKACVEGLAALAPEGSAPPSKIEQLAAVAQAMAGEGAALREMVARLIRQVVTPSWGRLVKRQLAARVRAETLALAWQIQAAGGRCAKTLDGEPAELITVHPHADGIEVRAVSWLDGPAPYVVRCTR